MIFILQIKQIINKIIDLLEILNKWIDEIPPLKQPQRYGNKAYRIWATRLVDVYINIIIVIEK